MKEFLSTKKNTGMKEDYLVLLGNGEQKVIATKYMDTLSRSNLFSKPKNSTKGTRVVDFGGLKAIESWLRGTLRPHYCDC